VIDVKTADCSSVSASLTLTRSSIDVNDNCPTTDDDCGVMNDASLACELMEEVRERVASAVLDCPSVLEEIGKAESLFTAAFASGVLNSTSTSTSVGVELDLFSELGVPGLLILPSYNTDT